jgi:hypothetical protein
MEKLYGQLIHLPHTKAQEWMEYSRPFYKRDGRFLSLIWRQVKVVFIPKPGRDSYGRPKDYRPISLTELPWRVGWLQSPGELEWPEAAHRKVSCHCSYCAPLLMK